MISLFSEPSLRTVLKAVSAAIVLSCSAFIGQAAAQDPAVADPAAAPAADAAPVETPPADAAAPAEAAPPADAAAAPADQTPASPETTAAAPYEETVPVNPTTSAEEPTAEASPEATKLEKVEVTGSRIKRTDYETAQPVHSISRKDIERTGVATLGELLQSLPSAGSALNTTFNNGGTGATEIDLRNLGSSRVLVLVNGHRWVNGLRSLSTSSVDLNTIPLPIIERIEILQDGASAIYGSDAIAGVVNIITRKDFQGANIAMQAGTYTQGGSDGAQQLHSISWGDLFGSGAGHTSVFTSMSFEDQRGMSTTSRDISKLPKEGTGVTRGSAFHPDSRLLFVPEPVNGLILGADKCPNIAHEVVQGVLDDPGLAIGPPFGSGGLPAVPITFPNISGIPVGVPLCDLIHIDGAPGSPLYTDYRRWQEGIDNYNYAPDNLISTPLRSYGAFIGLNHKFDTLELGFLQDLTFSFEGLYNFRESRQQLAAQPLCSGDACPIIGGGLNADGISINQRTYLAMDQQYNPFHQDIGRGDPVGGIIGLGAVLYRMNQLGRRVQEQHVPTFYLRPAISGAFDIFGQFLNWETGYGYGQSMQNEWLYNSIRLDHVQLGLGPTADCEAAPGCVPIDMVHGQVMTQEMLDYIGFTGVSRTKQVQKDLFANLSTSMEWWPMGPLGIAAGFEWRKDRYEFTPDSFAQSGISAGLFSQPTQGEVVAKEGFLEFNIPLLRDIFLIKELEVNVAGRISNYETFGRAQNGKVGLRYKPYDDLLLRGTYSSSFRAPNVGDLFLGEAQSFPALSDPCVTTADGGSREPGSNADVNCNADGANPDGQDNIQIVSPFKGNPDLRPETSHSFSAGFVFSPNFAPGLDFAFDVFRIYIEDFITAPGGQFILDSCYESDANFRQYCDRITRRADGQLQLVVNTFENVAKFVTGGADFNLGWTLPTSKIPGMENAGRFKIVTSATFLASYDQFTNSLDPTEEAQKTGLTGRNLGDNAYPRWKINPSLVYSNGGFEAAWNTRIVWKNRESCFDGFDPTLEEFGLCSDPDKLDAEGNDAPENVLDTVAKHDLQVSYRWAPSKFSLGLGVQNIFNTDPPRSYSAFKDTFDAADYWIPGTLIYAKLSKDF